MLSSEWLAAFLPVGQLREDGAWLPQGAGVLILSEPKVWFVTARHVVQAIGQQNASVLVPKSAGEGVFLLELSKILRESGIDWLMDQDSDLAAAPFPASPDFNIRAVSFNDCLPIEQVLPSMQCYTVGCPYGVRGFDPDNSLPLVMGGVIAGKSPKENLLYTSAPTFKGNSGGPLVVVKPPYSASGMLTAGLPTVFLAGLVLEMALVRSEEGRESQMPALHLGIAVSTNKVIELLKSKGAQSIAQQLKNQGS